jgi:hypothetical protein
MSIAKLTNKLQVQKCVAYFEKNPQHFQEMVRIVTRQPGALSLRRLERLCCIDAYEKNLYIKRGNDFISVRNLYENSLQTYRKKRFDPFCRKGRNGKQQVEVELHGVRLKTTVGQLNFFRVAFSFGLIHLI